MTLTTSCAATAAVVLGTGATTAGAVDYDLVVANGRIVDGTGAPWFRADVGIRRDRIAIIEIEGTILNAKSGGLLQASENPVSLFTQQRQAFF